MGEVLMLTLLVGVRCTLVDELNAATDEVFSEVLTLRPDPTIRVIVF